MKKLNKNEHDINEENSSSNKEIKMNGNGFNFVGGIQESNVVPIKNHSSATKVAFKELFRNKLAIVGMLIFLVLMITSIVVTLTSPYDPTAVNSNEILLPPSLAHPFGTDDFGRDIWTRIWFAIWISTVLALITATINIIIGTLVGISMGYFEWFDKLMSPVIKVLNSIPTILILILFSVVFGPSWGIIIISLTITGWVGSSQQTRAHTLRMRNQEFITASKTLGTGNSKIFGTFFLLAIPTIIIQYTILFPRMILAEAVLGFLGLSIPDIPTLGSLINAGRRYFLLYPMQTLYPIIFLTTLVGSIQFIGYGVEKSFGSDRTGR